MAERSRLAVVMIAVLTSCSPRLPPELPGAVDTPLAISPDGTILVPVVLHDQRGAPQVHQLVVDTGASISAIKPATAAALGLSASGSVVLNEGPDAVLGQVGILPQLSIGGITLTALRVAIVDMPAARNIRVPFAGILGLDVLEHYDVVIDLARRRCTFHPAGYAAKSAAAGQMQRLRFQRARYGMIALPARLEGFPQMIGVLDLGAQRSVINPVAARLLATFTPNSVLDPPPVIRRYLRVELDGVTLDHQGFEVEDLGIFHRLRLHRRPAILLGADLFQDRSIVLSYQERAIYVSR